MITSDVTLIGGGVIGLTAAYELARSGQRVLLVDSQQIGRESSWAGAGMIPPGDIRSKNPAYRAMARLSAGLWPELAGDLLEFTGVDNEYRQCGSVVLPEENNELAVTDPDEYLKQAERKWQKEGLKIQPLD